MYSDTSSNSDGPSEQRIDRRKAGLLATVPALSFGLVRWAQARAPRTGLTLTSAEVRLEQPSICTSLLGFSLYQPKRQWRRCNNLEKKTGSKD